MNLTVLNDLHLGAVRSAGTTPATAYQMRLDLLSQFEETLHKIDSDLMILGDLFDGPDISKYDLLQSYMLLRNWLEDNPTRLLFVVNGNHDLAKSTTNFSSFQLLAQLLREVDPARVTHVTEGMMTPHGYVIPHVTNQDLFDLEISKVPECEYLFVHCNYDNKFAVESDHSLNMSEEQAKAAPVSHIIFAHEHKARRALAGKVLVIGNQFPSSVSDCLETTFKRMLQIEDGTPLFVETWRAEGDYIELDWRSLKDGISDCLPERFIRVVGDAEAAEAAAVVTAISKFRGTSKALVITNAVKIAGVDDAEQLALSHEEVTAFNVREALREMLTDEENNKIDKLREQHA